MTEKRKTLSDWAESKYVRVLTDEAMMRSGVLYTEEQFEQFLNQQVFELKPGHPARVVPPPSDEEGYAVLKLAQQFRDEFMYYDEDPEPIGVDDVYTWLLRRARELGAR